MKRFMILSAMLTMLFGAAAAQGQMVVDSEKIFKSVAQYNQAVEQLDTLAKQYQDNIDTAYKRVEQMYNNYQAQKASMSASARQAQEDKIINSEKEIAKYQEEIFGQEGTLVKKRVEMIKPIQDRVFKIIEEYAAQNGFTLVIDIATNPTIIYYAPAINKTENIIALLK